MKICKFMTLTGALALALASCTDKDTPNVKNNESAKDGLAYTAFTIQMPRTRAEIAGPNKIGTANAGDTYTGAPNEQAVKTARIVFYNGNNVVKYSTDLKFDFSQPLNKDKGDVATHDKTVKEDDRNIPGGEDIDKVKYNQNQNTNFVTKALEMERGDYKVLVFLNPIDAVKNVTNVGNTLSQLVKIGNDNLAEAFTTTTAADLTKTDNGIQMANEKGLIKVDKNNFYLKAENAEAHPVKVKVERAVAKVFVNVNNDITTEGGFTFELGTTATKLSKLGNDNVKWGITVDNKRMYAYRQFAIYSPVFHKDQMESEKTLSDETAWDRYAIDPNYQGFNTKVTYASDFDYNVKCRSGELNNSNSTWNVCGYDSDDIGQYVMENTMDAANQYENLSTMVVAKIGYMPTSLGKQAGETWFSYGGQYFSKDQFTTIFNAAKDASDEEKQKTTADKYNCPEALIVFLNKQSGKLEEYVTSAKAFMANEEGEVVTIKDNQASGVLTGSPVLQCYEGGINYYNIPIRHFDQYIQQTTFMGYGRFGVVRNNIYKVNISKITGPGFAVPYVPTPGGTDPEHPTTPDVPGTPDEVQNYHIACNIEMCPWMVRVQNATL